MSRKSLRQKEIKKRKSFFPLLILSFLAWVFLGLIIFFLDPDFVFAKPLFFTILALASFLTFLIIFRHTRRSFLATLVVIVFFLLRLFGLGNLLNLFLLLGVVVAIEAIWCFN